MQIIEMPAQPRELKIQKSLRSPESSRFRRARLSKGMPPGSYGRTPKRMGKGQLQEAAAISAGLKMVQLCEQLRAVATTTTSAGRL
jgi:hypothetical protein